MGIATVCVPKRNGTIRICGDFKVSVNPVLISNPYPLPNAEDLFATLAGGRIFSNLDFSNAYQQLELTEESQKYLTINTHKVVYAYAYYLTTNGILFKSQYGFRKLHSTETAAIELTDTLLQNLDNGDIPIAIYF